VIYTGSSDRTVKVWSAVDVSYPAFVCLVEEADDIGKIDTDPI
jgi:hypothetical protein